VLAEVLSIVGYDPPKAGAHWSGAEISLAALTLVSLANNAIAYSVPGETDGLERVPLSFFRRHGASGASAGWTILTILIAQAIGMSLLLFVGVLVALSGSWGCTARGDRHRRPIRGRDRGVLLIRRDLLLRFLGSSFDSVDE